MKRVSKGSIVSCSIISQISAHQQRLQHLHQHHRYISSVDFDFLTMLLLILVL